MSAWLEADGFAGAGVSSRGEVVGYRFASIAGDTGRPSLTVASEELACAAGRFPAAVAGDWCDANIGRPSPGAAEGPSLPLPLVRLESSIRASAATRMVGSSVSTLS
jgi:hypothetical protein